MSAENNIAKILARTRFWSRKFYKLQPKNYDKRIRQVESLSTVFKGVIGLFLSPARSRHARYLYVLEGTRNLPYLHNVPNSSIALLGSWSERKIARDCGFGFYWAFPIVSAVELASRYRITLFLALQLKAWLVFVRFNQPLFILTYEDTQPLGAFLSQVSKSRLSTGCSYAICIQHGFFTKTQIGLPIDGSFTPYNFIWDNGQANIIKCDRSTAYVIGPPVTTFCDSQPIKQIVLVGSGTNDSGSDDYDSLLSFFSSVYFLLPLDIRSRVFYRPHPNECSSRELLKRLEALFGSIDLRAKVNCLSSPRSIFIGSVSSLLYEAEYCGHVSIAINGISKYEELAFQPSYQYGLNDIELVLSKIIQLINNQGKSSHRFSLPGYSFDSAIMDISSVNN